jgi:hypothetical protein
MMRPLMALAIFVLVGLGSTGSLRAQEFNSINVYQIVCIPELDLLEVRQLDFDGLDTPGRAIEHRRAIFEPRNLYSPHWHVRFNYYDLDPDFGIEPTTFTCPLSSGLAELVVLPEPLPHRTVSISIAVTLRVGDRLIVDDVPFGHCVIEGPIVRLTYNAADRSLALEEGLNEPWSYSSRTFHNDPFYPNRLTFLVADTGLRSLEPARVGWTVKAEPLRAVDIYSDFDEAERAGRADDACRYHGRGSPESRTRKPYR